MKFDMYERVPNDKYLRWDYYGVNMRYVGFSKDHPFVEWVPDSYSIKPIAWIEKQCGEEAIEYFENLYSHEWVKDRSHRL